MGPAVLMVDGGDALNRRAWEQRSNAVARGLMARGVQAGDPVVTLFDSARWIDFAVTYAGVAKAGGVAVPLAPRFSALELDRVLAHCRPKLVVCPRDLAPETGHAEVAILGDLEMGQTTEPLDPVGEPREILYDSGPVRGPCVLPGDARSLAGVPPGATFVHAFAVGSPAGQDTLRVLLNDPGAATVVVVPGLDPHRFCAAAAQAAEAAARRGSAAVVGITRALAAMLLHSGAPERHDLSGVASVVIAPCPSSPALVARIEKAFPGASVTVADPAQPPAPAEDFAPMTFTEEMLVWQEQFLPGCYNLPPFARVLRGPLDLDALRTALTEVSARHQALRTGFQVIDGRPVQVVRDPGPVALSVVDLSGFNPEKRQAELARVVGQATNRPVDLVEGSMFEPVVVGLGPDEHMLVVPMHHCVWDAWSVGVLHREMSAIYSDVVAGRPPSPAPPLWQMGDFSRWQHQLLAGDEGRTQRQFWESELAGAPLSLQLPIDDPALAEGTPHPAARPVPVVLAPPLAAGLRTLARAQRATPFMGMLAAFAALVHRCTGQDDFVISSVVANRNRTEVEGTVGCVAKRIPVRMSTSGDPTFPELILRAREALLGALSNQDIPDEVLQSEVLGREAARYGLVPTLSLMFQGLTVPRARLEMAGLEVENFDPTTITTKRVHVGGGAGGPAGATPWGGGLYRGTSMALFVSEGDDGITCLARGPFHRPAVERLLGHLRTLVADVVADPDRPLSQLRLLDHQDLARLAAEGRGEVVDMPADRGLHHLFADHVRCTPDRVAVLDGHTLHLGADPLAAVRDGHVDVVECEPAQVGAGLAEALAARAQAGHGEPVVVVTSSAPPPGGVWAELRSIAGSGHADVHWFYRPPGCTFVATSARLKEASARPTIGRPAANVECSVLDASATPVPEGVVGELHVGELHVGYPQVEGHTPCRTGQLARRHPGGVFELLGPATEYVELRGFRVRPSLMEAALGDCPGVGEVTVVVADDELVACVVPDGHRVPTLAELRRHLWARLPGYAWPSQLVIDGAIGPTTEPTTEAPAEAAHRSDAERMLATLWAEALGVEAVDPSGDYRQSFAFVEAVAAARQAGLHVPSRHVMKNRTVEAVAAALVAEAPTVDSAPLNPSRS